MTALEIIELSIIGIAILIIGIYTIAMAIKNKWFFKIFETLKLAIKEAELKFPEQCSGEKKKAYVVAKIEEKCKELGIPYKTLKKLIELAIDKIVDDYNIISK